MIRTLTFCIIFATTLSPLHAESDSSWLSTYPKVCDKSEGDTFSPFCLFYGYMHFVTFGGKKEYISQGYIDQTGIVRARRNLSTFTAGMPTVTMTWRCSDSLSSKFCLPVKNAVAGITLGFTDGVNTKNSNRLGAMALGLTYGAILIGGDSWGTIFLGLSVGGYWDNTIQKLPSGIEAGLLYPYANLSAQPNVENAAQIALLNETFQIPHESITGRYGYVGIVINGKVNWTAFENSPKKAASGETNRTDPGEAGPAQN